MGMLRVAARLTLDSTMCCCGCRPSSAARPCPGSRGIGRGRLWVGIADGGTVTIDLDQQTITVTSNAD